MNGMNRSKATLLIQVRKYCIYLGAYDYSTPLEQITLREKLAHGPSDGVWLGSCNGEDLKLFPTSRVVKLQDPRHTPEIYTKLPTITVTWEEPDRKDGRFGKETAVCEETKRAEAPPKPSLQTESMPFSEPTQPISKSTCKESNSKKTCQRPITEY